MAPQNQVDQPQGKTMQSKPNEKHLEFLQNNIARMNQCSFQMKGWSITIASALIAVFVSTISGQNPGSKIYLMAAIAATVLFWCLDSLYLSKERRFIGMYNDLIGVGNGEKQTIVQIKEYEIPMENTVAASIAFSRQCSPHRSSCSMARLLLACFTYIRQCKI